MFMSDFMHNEEMLGIKSFCPTLHTRQLCADICKIIFFNNWTAI